MIRCCAVIPFYNGERFIESCLKSILENTLIPAKIFIVDNSPNPLSLTAYYAKNDRIKIVKTNPGIGFARASNLGLYHARKERFQIAVLLNQDLVIDQHCFEELLAPFANTRGGIFMSLPMSLTYDLESISNLYFHKYLTTFSAYLKDLIFDRHKSSYPLDNEFQGNGACMCIAVSSFWEMGGFDPLFRMYGEERDLFNRALNQFSQEILFCPKARVGHVHGNDQENSNHTFFLTEKGMILFQFKDVRQGTWSSVGKTVWMLVTHIKYVFPPQPRLSIWNYLKIWGFLIGNASRAVKNRSIENQRKLVDHYLKVDDLGASSFGR